jgi:hypothetical protein
MTARIHSKKSIHARAKSHRRGKHAGRGARGAHALKVAAPKRRRVSIVSVVPDTLVSPTAVVADVPAPMHMNMPVTADSAEPAARSSLVPSLSATGSDAGPVDSPSTSKSPHDGNPHLARVRLAGIAVLTMVLIVGLALSGERERRDGVSGPDGADSMADGGTDMEAAWEG